jgi:tol-pal system protein YbgF
MRKVQNEWSVPSNGAHVRAPLRTPLRGAAAIVGAFCLSMAGCATQADFMDLQTSLEKSEAEQAEIQNRLRVVESYFKERSTTVQRGQADIVIKLDQVAVDLQALQGKVEESSHALADVSQRIDDQTFHSKELTGRMDAVDGQMVALEKSVADLERSIQVIEKVVNIPPELKSSATPGATPPGEGAPSEQTVVLPGRPTEKDKAAGVSPSQAYGLAYNDYLKGNYDLALLGFQNFLTQFKGTSLAPNAQYWIGECFYGKKDFVKSIESFDRVVADYPKSDKVPGALLKAGYAWVEVGDKAKARAYLKRVVENYPLSNEGRLAKNKLAELK